MKGALSLCISACLCERRSEEVRSCVMLGPRVAGFPAEKVLAQTDPLGSIPDCRANIAQAISSTPEQQLKIPS